jgi:2-methylfumaryl-CoA isomerase
VVAGTPGPMASTVTMPLAGLRIVEISGFVAAPLGGMTLAQLGAEVIRVDPLGGASDRHRWPITRTGASLYWNGLNQGKKSVCLDLRSSTGQELVARLVAESGPDGGIALTNAVGRAGLSYAQLRQTRPDLIFMKIQGHHDGTPAVDYTVNAAMGFPMVTGPQGHADPVNHVLPAWDIACGLYAATALLAAERRRRLDGRGMEMSIALHDVAVAMAGNLGLLAEAQVNQVNRARIGNYLYGGFARDFTCQDGRRVMVVALTRRHWEDLLDVTEMRAPVRALEEALAVDFSQEDDRFAYREVLAGLFARWFEGQPHAEVAVRLRPTSLLWSTYRTFTEVVSEERGRNPILSVVDQPGVGPLLTPGSPIHLDTGVTPAVPAPLMGQDTAAVLSTLLGLDGDELAQLQRAGVIDPAPVSQPASF